MRQLDRRILVALVTRRRRFSDHELAETLGVSEDDLRAGLDRLLEAGYLAGGPVTAWGWSHHWFTDGYTPTAKGRAAGGA